MLNYEMAAAPECMPVPTGVEMSHQFAMTQYDRRLKEEVLDPGYNNGHIGTPIGIPIGTPVGSSMMPLAPTHVPPATTNGTPPADKPKRSYTRKPSAGPKAKKVKTEPAVPDPNAPPNGTAQSQIGDHMPVQKKKRDRFKGTTEEEVLTRVLPDHIRDDLDILIVGINPGLTAAYVQHHYAGPGNHFWKCLYLSKMIPEPMNALQDAELQNFGIGFTNIVARTTRGSADLTKKEIFEGGEILKTKMLKYLPKIALFNGKGIYEVFCGHKNFCFGLQPDPFPGCPETSVFVNPSSSARCTQLPRAIDKVPFFEALKRVRDHIRAHGTINGIDRSTVTFPDFKLVTAPQKNKVKEEPAIPGENTDKSNPASNVAAPSTDTKPVKTKKPRARSKKEKASTGMCAASTSASMPIPIGNQNPPQQPFVDTNPNRMQPRMNELPAAPPNPSNQQLHSTQLQHTGGDFTNIKQEVLENSHHDKDLAAIIQQSINVQQSMFQQQQQQQQSSVPPNTVPPPVTGNGTGLVLSSTVPSSVKQERSDWNGYGVMPTYTPNTPTSMGAYPQYSCYWSYLPPAAPFMTNAYPAIPAPQIAHQQAVAAAAALHTSVNVSQPNTTVSAAAPPAVSYNSSQEASSPAMSSQSNLTQASLDSLPKADSASTVANWLQSIPHS